MKKALQQLLDSFVQSGAVPGVCASVTLNGCEPVYAAAGWADAEGLQPMNEDTQLRVYSLTKPVIACAVMQLTERGRISLNDPVAAYLPSFTHQTVCQADGTTAPARPCTLLHLLQMTSGIVPYYRDDSPSVSALRNRIDAATLQGSPFSTEQLADEIAGIPLRFQPGEGFLYGMSYEVLAAIIEKVVGIRLSTYLHQAIFEPLRMSRTAFFSSCPGKRADILKRSNGVLTTAPEARYQPVLQLPSIEWGGDGLYSSLRDYTQFANALAFGSPILSTASLHRIIQPEPLKLCRESFDEIPILHSFSYGLGVRVAEVGGQAGEFGWYGHAGNWFMCHAEKRVSAVLLAQYLPSPHTALIPPFRDFVYQAIQT